MHAPKTRSSSSSEVNQKVSGRAVRQMRTTTIDTNSISSSSSSTTQVNRFSKERSPKLNDRKSPRSPVPLERKRPSKISELESQISQLQDDLKKVMDQLVLTESSKKQAQQDAEESKEQLLTLSAKLKESQNQYQELCANGEARDIELQRMTEERDRAWQSEVDASEKHLSVDSTALASAVNEIQLLKVQLELVANCGSVQSQHAESSNTELLNLKQKLSESLSLMESMKNQLDNSKESEAQAQAVVNDAMFQLEAAKRTVDILADDAVKDVDDYNSIALELEHSRARVNTLETLVSKLKTHVNDNESTHSDQNLLHDHEFEKECETVKEGEDPNQIEVEICSLKSEVERLRSALETTETRYQQEQIQSTVQMKTAYELMEQIKSESAERQRELEIELLRKKANIEELKANLMDKETELQGIMEENENLNSKLENNMSSQNDNGLAKEVKRLEQCLDEMKANMMDKETTLQTISEENETLKIEISERCSDIENAREEIEKAKAAERELATKLGIAMEEADRSNRKAARVTEQLEAAQAESSEMESELRKLKIQSDQWRKAAEAAAAMLSAGNNEKLTERGVSLENNYKCSPPYGEDIDDEFQRKKNGNMLKKIGVLWKKPQK